MLAAAEAAYREVIEQQGWVEADVAACAVRNRLAEQFAVPPLLVHTRLVRWPCHVYGRIAQALAAEELTLPPLDWFVEEEAPRQRLLFETGTRYSKFMANTSAGIRAAQWGLFVNSLLVLVKLVSGIVGNSYALIADGIESSTDIFSSLVVWGGLQVAARPADESHPYGHGKAESLAAAVVALMLLGAAIRIAIAAVREILTPHHSPMPFTLSVVAAVVVVKEILYRNVFHIGETIGSTAVEDRCLAPP